MRHNMGWVIIYDSSDFDHFDQFKVIVEILLHYKIKWVINYDSSWVSKKLVTNHSPFRVSKAVKGLSRNKKDFKDSTLSHLIFFQPTIFGAITTSYILSRQHSTWLSTSRILSHEYTWGYLIEKNPRHRRSKYTGKHSNWTVNKLSRMFYSYLDP